MLNLDATEGSLPDLADKAHAGETIILTDGKQELAVIVGIEEYRRLKKLEEEQRDQDFNILLSSDDTSTLSEEEANELAVQAVREVRRDHKGSARP